MRPREDSKGKKALKKQSVGFVILKNLHYDKTNNCGLRAKSITLIPVKHMMLKVPKLRWNLRSKMLYRNEIPWH